MVFVKNTLYAVCGVSFEFLIQKNFGLAVFPVFKTAAVEITGSSRSWTKFSLFTISCSVQVNLMVLAFRKIVAIIP